MTNNEYNNYKLIAQKVINLLCTENCSSIYDIKVIYNTIMGFPYCVDCEGHYIYNGQFYNSINELPIKAIQQIK